MSCLLNTGHGPGSYATRRRVVSDRSSSETVALRLAALLDEHLSVGRGPGRAATDASSVPATRSLVGQTPRDGVPTHSWTCSHTCDRFARHGNRGSGRELGVASSRREVYDDK